MGPSVDRAIWMIFTVRVEPVGLANDAISDRVSHSLSDELLLFASELAQLICYSKLMGSAQRTRASLASVSKQNAEMVSLVNVHPTVLDRCVSMVSDFKLCSLH